MLRPCRSSFDEIQPLRDDKTWVLGNVVETELQKVVVERNILEKDVVKDGRLARQRAGSKGWSKQQ